MRRLQCYLQRCAPVLRTDITDSSIEPSHNEFMKDLDYLEGSLCRLRSALSFDITPRVTVNLRPTKISKHPTLRHESVVCTNN
jgi:hypothetical protein